MKLSSKALACGQSCGASIGPGLYAIFYFGRPISSGLTEERSLIAELTGKTK